LAVERLAETEHVSVRIGDLGLAHLVLRVLGAAQ
jgi:hypothetical protein